jgi:hypothetical protein
MHKFKNPRQGKGISKSFRIPKQNGELPSPLIEGVITSNITSILPIAHNNSNFRATASYKYAMAAAKAA